MYVYIHLYTCMLYYAHIYIKYIHPYNCVLVRAHVELSVLFPVNNFTCTF